MPVPKKPTLSTEAIDDFISGKKEGNAGTQPSVKVRKKPVRLKEEVLRQTFVMSKVIVDRLEAYAFWNRLTKKAVLEAALEAYFKDKKIRPIPRQ
jgi:hypothetical protein